MYILAIKEYNLLQEEVYWENIHEEWHDVRLNIQSTLFIASIINSNFCLSHTK